MKPNAPCTSALPHLRRDCAQLALTPPLHIGAGTRPTSRMHAPTMGEAHTRGCARITLIRACVPVHEALRCAMSAFLSLADDVVALTRTRSCSCCATMGCVCLFVWLFACFCCRLCLRRDDARLVVARLCCPLLHIALPPRPEAVVPLAHRIRITAKQIAPRVTQSEPGESRPVQPACRTLHAAPDTSHVARSIWTRNATDATYDVAMDTT